MANQKVSDQTIPAKLLQELSPEEQQLLSGGYGHGDYPYDHGDYSYGHGKRGRRRNRNREYY
jgi:hypothetical protein